MNRHVDFFGYGTAFTPAGPTLGASVPDEEDHGALNPLSSWAPRIGSFDA